MMGVKAELSGQKGEEGEEKNHHLNPIDAHVFEEGMSDLLLRGENRTVHSLRGRGGGTIRRFLTSEMIRGFGGVRLCERDVQFIFQRQT